LAPAAIAPASPATGIPGAAYPSENAERVGDGCASEPAAMGDLAKANGTGIGLRAISCEVAGPVLTTGLAAGGFKLGMNWVTGRIESLGD